MKYPFRIPFVANSRPANFDTFVGAATESKPVTAVTTGKHFSI